MSPWQVIQQLRYRAQSLVWSGGDRVIGSVIVSPAVAAAALDQGVMLPALILSPGGERSDDEEPESVRATLQVTLLAAAQSDGMGEGGMLGAGRISGTGAAGRGLLEVEEQLRPVLTGLADVGVRAYMRAVSAPAVSQVQGTSSIVVSRQYTVDALCTTHRTYAAATRLVASGGSGSIALSWRLPGLRWDLLSMILRRASGSTAPSGPTDGTGVTLASALATSVTDSVGAGTYSYALFAAYDDYAVPTIDGPAWLAAPTATTARSYSPSATATAVAS
jgi:hypothetical protein